MVAQLTSTRHRQVPVVESVWDVQQTTRRAAELAEIETSSDAFMRSAEKNVRSVDPATQRALKQFGIDQNQPGSMILRGVPVGHVPSTPSSPFDHVQKDSVSELSLMTVARLLGEPVGYLPEHGGDIVQNISPTAGDITRQTSTSSGVVLAFHTETAFHEHKPRFLLLLCLRGDNAARTTLCCIDDAIGQLSEASRTVLFQPRFHTKADESFGGGVGASFGAPMAVLSGEIEHPTMIFDQELTSGIDDEAQRAVAELTSLIVDQHTSVTLETGDMAVIDNHRCVHGRSPFTARFDGTDRWLQRTFVIDDLVPSATERDGRIITTTFDH